MYHFYWYFYKIHELYGPHPPTKWTKWTPTTHKVDSYYRVKLNGPFPEISASNTKGRKYDEESPVAREGHGAVSLGFNKLWVKTWPDFDTKLKVLL